MYKSLIKPTTATSHSRLQFRAIATSSLRFNKMSPPPFKYQQPKHKLTLIPGPIEFSNDVLASMATPSQAHTSPEFIATFQYVLKRLRKLFKSSDPNSQGYVLSGSGTLGWDVAAANLLVPGDKVLVLSTGFFSDSFAEALKVYGIEVDVITAKVGDVVPLDQVKDALQKTKYAAITITHVDTSTSVVSDVEGVSKIVKEVSPNTLIIVDGVCSIGVENLEFDKWGIDFALTASQKAIGVPAGLSIFYISERALAKALNREKETTFFASLKRWTPIMKSYEAAKPAYFATPAVQTITALSTSLDEIFSESLDERFAKQAQVSDKFKKTCKDLGLTILPVDDKVAAHGLTAVYFPEGVDGPALLKKLSEKGFVVAGGIHKALPGKYFRVGHMGYSSYAGHLDAFAKALEESLKELKQ